MESLNHYRELLNCLPQPAFLISESAILLQNPAAAPAAAAFSARFDEGLPQPPAVISSGIWTFTLHAMDQLTLVLAAETNKTEVSAQAVSSLRLSLVDLYTSANALIPAIEELEDSSLCKQAARLKQGLYKLHRSVSNIDFLTAQPPVPRCTKLDLCGVLCDLEEMIPQPCTNSGVTLQFDLPNKPLYISGDSQLLERAILNLISNALRHAKENSVVTVSAVKQGSRALLTVQNIGQPADPDLLFGTSTESWLQGTAGIGLDLVRRIVQLMDGTLLFRMPDEGTIATMAFPIQTGTDGILRTPMMRPDYTGGFQPALLELSDVLPLEVFYPEALD